MITLDHCRRNGPVVYSPRRGSVAVGVAKNYLRWNRLGLQLGQVRLRRYYTMCTAKNFVIATLVCLMACVTALGAGFNFPD